MFIKKSLWTSLIVFIVILISTPLINNAQETTATNVSNAPTPTIIDKPAKTKSIPNRVRKIRNRRNCKTVLTNDGDKKIICNKPFVNNDDDNNDNDYNNYNDDNNENTKEKERVEIQESTKEFEQKEIEPKEISEKDFRFEKENCKIKILDSGKKKIFCETKVKSDRNKLPINSKRILPNLMFNRQNDENESKTYPKNNRFNRKIKNAEFKNRMEIFRENVKENRDTLKEKYEKKREALKLEIKAQGKGGLEKILQNKDKRAIITKMQEEKLRLRLMNNFEKISIISTRLTDITERIKSRLSKIEENKIDTSPIKSILKDIDSEIIGLDEKINNAIDAINGEDIGSLKDLKTIGTTHISNIKDSLKGIKTNIGDTIKILKNILSTTSNQ